MVFWSEMAGLMVNLAKITVFCGLVIFTNGQCTEQPGKILPNGYN